MSVVKMKKGDEDVYFVVTGKNIIHTEGKKYLDEEPTLLRMAFGFCPEGFDGTTKLHPFQKDHVDWHPYYRDWTYAVDFDALTGEHEPRYDVCNIVELTKSEFVDKIKLP